MEAFKRQREGWIRGPGQARGHLNRSEETGLSRLNEAGGRRSRIWSSFKRRAELALQTLHPQGSAGCSLITERESPVRGKGMRFPCYNFLFSAAARERESPHRPQSQMTIGARIRGAAAAAGAAVRGRRAARGITASVKLTKWIARMEGETV